MRPQFIRRNNKFFNESFSVRYLRLPHFEKFWHYHIEMELAYNLKSTGTRFIGDSIAPFEEGEIIFLGYNLPHVWLNDPHYFENRENLFAESINIHFEKDILGNSFFITQELKEIGQLIERASRGIVFLGNSKKIVPPLLLEMLDTQDSFERLILLLKVLKILASEPEYEYIASLGYPERFNTKDARMSKIFNYILHHFQNPIALEDVAKIAQMNKSAFCRYFKKVTNKHFVEYLNEVRISYACKLLLEQKYTSITDVCFASGYNNLSNFNQQFKKIKKISPSDFMQKYSEVFIAQHLSQAEKCSF